MANQGNTNTPTEPTDVDVESGIIYIRYHATIDTKPNGQMKINGKRPFDFDNKAEGDLNSGLDLVKKLKMN